jgi:superfamily I DNA/RNA helicase
MVDLSSLNPAQFQAVAQSDGALLVLAGAGSGKTRVITFRIAKLIDDGVPAHRILALSFTNKAAGEMRERVAHMIGPAARDCVLSTFHALGVRFLREEAAHVGLTANFTILDEGDQRDAVRGALVKLGFDPARYEPKAIHARISDYKGRIQVPDRRVDAIAHHIYPLYQQRLRALNAVDFDDLITLPVRALESSSPDSAGLRHKWAHRFRYIMVDEYQDTNGAQLRFVKGLAKGHGNVCVVGDDDQSIYAFRGAVAGNILHFDQHFPGAKMVPLTQNYRSTNNVLRAANAVIGNNVERHAKTLWSENGDGPLLRYHLSETEEEEAHWIATDLLGLRHRKQLNWSDCAILYRTNAQARALEQAVRGADIPYQIIGGTRFFDRKEVRDVVAYLRVISNPFDETAYRRIINYPSRGIGDVSIQRLADYAAAEGIPFCRVVEKPEDVEGLTPKVRTTLKQFAAAMDGFRTRFAQTQGEMYAEVCRDLIRHFGFADALVRVHKGDPRQVRKRIDNVEEMASALANWKAKNPDKSMTDYLAGLSLDTRKDESGKPDEDQISLMTLHGSKGLEFKAVYLAGWEEGFLPHQRVLDGHEPVDEERRLAYVGITRAKVHLALTGARKRLKFGRVQRRRPSRFLQEIPENLIVGGYGGGPRPRTEEEQKAHAQSGFGAMLSLLSDD